MIHSRPQAVFRWIFCLFLLVAAEAPWAKPWKSAEMITQQNYKYGAFEARIRGAEGSGMITAFFLYKNGSEWAGAEWQEQDFELFGKNGNFQSQLMTPGDPRVEHVVNHSLPTPVWNRYYTYRMEWTPTAMSFYVDGKLIRRETDAVTYAKLLDPARAEPMNMRISLWAGDIPWSGSFDSTKVPAAVDVNWAQVSSYTPGAGPGGSDFTPLWRDDFNSINTSRWYFANWTFEYAVNDYTAGAANTSNGYLQLKMTHWSKEGQQFTPSPIDDGLLNPPSDTPPPTDTTTTPTDPTDPSIPPTTGPGTPVAIPGILEAWKPSRYVDLTPGNDGSALCSTGDLDAEPSTEGGCNIGWSQAGEWQEFDVTVATAGDYDMTLRAASALGNVHTRILVDGVDASGVLGFEPAGWQSLVDIPAGRVSLAAGTHTVRIVHLTEGTNTHTLGFASVGSTLEPPAVVQTPAAVPGPVQVALSWSAAARATSYEIQRGPVGGPYVAVGTTTTTSWTDLAVVAGTGYGYVVVARNAAGSALPSAPVSATPLAPVPADVPSALVATAGDARVDLSWSKGANNTSYKVYRSLDGVSFTLVGSPSSASYADVGLANGTAYTYHVTGVYQTRESVPSATVSATPRGLPPPAVTQLVATPGNGQITLSWVAVPGATSYLLYRVGADNLPVLFKKGAFPSLSIVLTGLVNGTSYTYRILSANAYGSAATMATVTATPVAPIPGVVKAQYQVGTTGSTNAIRPLLKLVNTTASAIPLSELTIRYWFTNEGAKSLSYWCDWANVGTANITGSFASVSPARTGADSYLQIGFKPAAGQLAASGSTGEIQIRFSKSDWSNFVQTDDASYNAALSAYADWNKVTVYRNGTLIWGVEP